MKKIVATVVAAMAAGALAAVINLGGPAGSTSTASASASASSTRTQVDQVANHFQGGGAGFVLEAVAGRNADCAAALQHAGVVFAILGLGGFAVVASIRLRAAGLVQLRAR